MSSVNAINSNVSFGRAKKAEKAEKQPKVSKHIQKRAMEKYGVDYMSLSPEAQKIIKKDIKYEYAAIGLTTLGAAGLSLAFARNQKVLNGFTEALINTGKTLARKLPVVGKKFETKLQVPEGGKKLNDFVGDRLMRIINGAGVKAEEKQLSGLREGVLTHLKADENGVIDVKGVNEFLKKTLANEETTVSVKETAQRLAEKINAAAGENTEIQADKLKGIISEVKIANGGFDTNSKLHQGLVGIFGKKGADGNITLDPKGAEKLNAVEGFLSKHGITNGASAADTALAGVAAVGIGNKAGDVMDDATDLNNGEVTEDALIANIQEHGSIATLKAFGGEAIEQLKSVAF